MSDAGATLASRIDNTSRGAADGEVSSMPGLPKALGRGAALLVVALAAVACGAPSDTFVASPDNDLVIKLPRTWSTVRTASSADSATGQPDGGWNAVFDASRPPDASHVDLSSKVLAPVAYARVAVLSDDQASSMDADKLRDIMLPFTASARAQVSTDPRAATFKQISDYDVRSSVASGAHVVYSYDLGHGREVFDQIAMIGSQRTRVYLLLVRCDQSCYDTHRAEISAVVNSFTVKVP
jgi:hypothetical protein